MLVKEFDRPKVTARVRQIASGQRQDSWLSAAVIWGVILCKELPYQEPFFVAGSFCLVWLIVRSCQRINMLVKERCQ